jgi:catabolite regulation protein CreA
MIVDYADAQVPTIRWGAEFRVQKVDRKKLEIQNNANRFFRIALIQVLFTRPRISRSFFTRAGIPLALLSSSRRINDGAAHAAWYAVPLAGHAVAASAPTSQTFSV